MKPAHAAIRQRIETTKAKRSGVRVIVRPRGMSPCPPGQWKSTRLPTSIQTCRPPGAQPLTPSFGETSLPHNVFNVFDIVWVEGTISIRHRQESAARILLLLNPDLTVIASITIVGVLKWSLYLYPAGRGAHGVVVVHFIRKEWRRQAKAAACSSRRYLLI
jgi:hypothetical protein